VRSLGVPWDISPIKKKKKTHLALPVSINLMRPLRQNGTLRALDPSSSFSFTCTGRRAVAPRTLSLPPKTFLGAILGRFSHVPSKQCIIHVAPSRRAGRKCIQSSSPVRSVCTSESLTPLAFGRTSARLFLYIGMTLDPLESCLGR